MAATEACAAPVQADNTETKTEEAKTTNAEPTNTEGAPEATKAEETKETTTVNEEAQNGEQPAVEQPADGKAKPASENILGSFLNKSGLGKLMGGGKKKKEASTGGEDGATTAVAADGEKDKKDADEGNKEQPASQTADGAEAGPAEDQAIEKVPENDEAVGKDAKVEQGVKSTVRDFIRKPVARIFSHRSTEKKEGDGKKHGKVRSMSLDRMEDADPDSSAVTVDQGEDVQEATEESDKGAAQTTKHMRRWHSFKKMMAQKAHKKSTDDSKEGEGGEEAGAGDSSTLDSTTKSEHSGHKRWKLKRSWTFQGLKRDPSVTGFGKSKEGEKEGTEKGEETTEGTENDQGTAAVSEESKAAVDGETQEKSGAEGDEEKGAAAAPQRTKSVDQHANEIWTSFKKRVIPKSKKPADASGTTGVEEGAEPTGEQEQTDEQQAAKDAGKSAKTKRTHFNRAVSLKNFIMRKGGKSTSVDEAGAKEDAEGQDGVAEDGGEGKATTEGTTADAAAADSGTTASDAPKTTTEAKQETGTAAPAVTSTAATDTTTVTSSKSDEKAAVTPKAADQQKATAVEEKKDASEAPAPTAPASQPAKAEAQSPAEMAPVATEPVAENGCPDGTAVHNHEEANADGETNCKEAINEDVGGKAKDGKIMSPDGKCGGKGNAVAQSGECASADIDLNRQQHQHPEGQGPNGAGLEAPARYSERIEAGERGPPQNGGSLAGTEEAYDGRCDKQDEEEVKKMFYQAATSIVSSVMSAAAKQLEKEMDYLDNSFKCSETANSGNYPDIDVGYYH